MVTYVSSHQFHSSLVSLLLYSSQTLSLVDFSLLGIGSELRVACISSSLLLGKIFELLLHFLSGLAEHLFLHLRDMIVLLLFFGA